MMKINILAKYLNAKEYHNPCHHHIKESKHGSQNIFDVQAKLFTAQRNDFLTTEIFWHQQADFLSNQPNDLKNNNIFQHLYCDISTYHASIPKGKEKSGLRQTTKCFGEEL